jgi:integrase
MRGQGRVFQRGKQFWIAYMLDGVEKREPAQTTDMKRAEKFLKERIDERGAHRLGLQTFTTAEMKKITICDLLENVKADLNGKGSPQTLSTIKQADEAFGHYKAMSLSSQNVKDYIARQQADGYKNATINRVTGMLRHAFTVAVEEGKISRAPHIKQLSESDNVRQGICSEAEFIRVRENLPADLRDFATFAFRSGWRRGEIAELDWENIKENDPFVRLRPEQAKNKHGRKLPLVGELVGVIGRRRQARSFQANGVTQLSNLVFHRRGREVFEFRKAWHTACKKAGVPNLLFHDLRRAACSAMTNAKVPMLVAMQISGHKTQSMFKRYNIGLDDELVNAMTATEQWQAAQSQKAAQQANVRAIASK